MQPETEAQHREVGGAAGTIELGHAGGGLEGGIERSLADRAGGAAVEDREHRQHRIADEFEHLAAVRLYRGHHTVEVIVENRDQRITGEGVGERGEPPEVARPNGGAQGLAVAAADLALRIRRPASWPT